VQDLTPDQMIHIMGLEHDWLRVFQLLKVDFPKGIPRATVDTSLAAIELVAAGLGCAIVLRSFAQSGLGRGRVEIVPGIELPQPQSHYLLTPEDNKWPKPEAMIFREWLSKELGG